VQVVQVNFLAILWTFERLADLCKNAVFYQKVFFLKVKRTVFVYKGCGFEKDVHGCGHFKASVCLFRLSEQGKRSPFQKKVGAKTDEKNEKLASVFSAKKKHNVALVPSIWFQRFDKDKQTNPKRRLFGFRDLKDFFLKPQNKASIRGLHDFSVTHFQGAIRHFC
jgi:hypothetical protein